VQYNPALERNFCQICGVIAVKWVDDFADHTELTAAICDPDPFLLSIYPMAYEGYIDHANCNDIRGWVYDNRCPDTPLEVEILEGERVVARVTAGDYRADLEQALKGNGKHAFAFAVDQPVASVLRARVAGRRWFIAPSGGHWSANRLPMRFDATLCHSLEYGLPEGIGQQGFSSAISVGEDPELGGRLLRAYQQTMRDCPADLRREHDGVRVAESEHLAELFELLDGQNAEGLIKYLREAHAKGITHGITQGAQTTRTLKSSADARRLVMLSTLDYLTSLGEWLDVLDVECPDQRGQWGENIHAEPLALVDRITAVTGVHVVLPQVIGSAFGLRTGHGIVTMRDLLALYAARQIRLLIRAGAGGPPSGSVCELGGGLGSTAYYANRLGVARYAIVDVPIVHLLQGYFLIRALPEVKVALYGEDDRDAAIRLLPDYAAEAVKGVDLVLNQDSLPTMRRESSLAKIREMQAERVPLFLSINQEARGPRGDSTNQSVVRELLAAAGGGGYVRRQKSRHWLRAGYVEELYVLGEG
jgi:hypothetical protein